MGRLVGSWFWVINRYECGGAAGRGGGDDDVAAVQAVFQSRIDTQAAGGAWYPASCETWEQGVITSASNVVGMFVYPEDAQGMADLFTETFGN